MSDKRTRPVSIPNTRRGSELFRFPDEERMDEEIGPYWRPKTRGDCAEVERPCPYVGCKFHLYLDVNETNGSMKLNFPSIGPDEMTSDSCSLDVAEEGRHTLLQIGRRMALVRERARQVEAVALRKFKANAPDGVDLLDFD